jgi:hypothetical protein
MQRLNRSFVAVSKLCCPTCWIFSQRLRGLEWGDFNVCGHHSTLYAVDLPGYISDSLRQDMVTALLNHLGAQLKQMVLPRPVFTIKFRRLSIESDLGSTTTTTSQEGEAPERIVTASQTIQE